MLSHEVLGVISDLYLYGPWDIPKKKKWIIVGSGPTAHLVLGHIGPETGVMTLNAELAGIPSTTVHFFSHYEYYLPCINYLDNAEIVFFANPMHVGFRCVGISSENLLDYDRILMRYPKKFRFFEKETNKNKLPLRSHTLYCRDTLASTAAHLLAINGVKEAFFCGIDGHEISAKLGRSRLFSEVYKANDEVNQRASKEGRYDQELKDFLAFSKEIGVSMKNLNEKESTAL